MYASSSLVKRDPTLTAEAISHAKFVYDQVETGWQQNDTGPHEPHDPKQQPETLTIRPQGGGSSSRDARPLPVHHSAFAPRQRRPSKLLSQIKQHPYQQQRQQSALYLVSVGQLPSHAHLLAKERENMSQQKRLEKGSLKLQALEVEVSKLQIKLNQELHRQVKLKGSSGSGIGGMLKKRRPSMSTQTHDSSSSSGSSWNNSPNSNGRRRSTSNDGGEHVRRRRVSITKSDRRRSLSNDGNDRLDSSPRRRRSIKNSSGSGDDLNSSNRQRRRSVSRDGMDQNSGKDRRHRSTNRDDMGSDSYVRRRRSSLNWSEHEDPRDRRRSSRRRNSTGRSASPELYRSNDHYSSGDDSLDYDEYYDSPESRNSATRRDRQRRPSRRISNGHRSTSPNLNDRRSEGRRGSLQHGSAQNRSDRRRSSAQGDSRRSLGNNSNGGSSGSGSGKTTRTTFLFRRKLRNGKILAEKTVTTDHPAETTMSQLIKRKIQGHGSKTPDGQKQSTGVLSFTADDADAIVNGTKRVIFHVKHGDTFDKEEFGDLTAAEVLDMHSSKSSLVIDIMTESC